jgi:hypothetical protein
MQSSSIIREKQYSPFLLLRGGQSEVAAPAAESGEDQVSEHRRPICCRACSSEVTTVDARIVIDGSHFHNFFNPAGIVYELHCFSHAKGCLITGQPTYEFTWFAGHAWSYALCRSCQTHLGWFYFGKSSSFFGLIRMRLIE